MNDTELLRLPHYRIRQTIAQSTRLDKLISGKSKKKSQKFSAYLFSGGTAVPIEALPWMAQLSLETASGAELCGGAVIHEEFIITGTSCKASFYIISDDFSCSLCRKSVKIGL